MKYKKHNTSGLVERHCVTGSGPSTRPFTCTPLLPHTCSTQLVLKVNVQYRLKYDQQGPRFAVHPTGPKG